MLPEHQAQTDLGGTRLKIFPVEEFDPELLPTNHAELFPNVLDYESLFVKLWGTRADHA
jgi:hypothetical protein